MPARVKHFSTSVIDYSEFGPYHSGLWLMPGFSYLSSVYGGSAGFSVGCSIPESYLGGPPTYPVLWKQGAINIGGHPEIVWITAGSAWTYGYCLGRNEGFPDATVGGVGGVLVDDMPQGGWDLSFGASPQDVWALSMVSDTLSAHIGQFTISAAGTLSITDCPFEPQLVLIYGMGPQDYGGVFSLGACDAALNQWVTSMNMPWLKSGIQGYHRLQDGRVIYASPDSSFAGSVSIGAAITALTGSGFTLDVDTYSQSAIGTFGYVAFAETDPDAGFAVGVNNWGDAVSGLPFDPDALYMASALTAATGDEPNDSLITVGVADIDGAAGSGYSERSGAGYWRQGNGIVSLFQGDSGGSVLRWLTATPVPGGFTTTTDDTSKLFGWIAMNVGPANADYLPILGVT